MAKKNPVTSIRKDTSDARIHVETPVIPECSYPLPPYHFIGQGITIMYEIPFSRVKNVIPAVFEPDPGRQKIWFMVSYYDWKSFFPLSNPDEKHSFYECYYKFSVTHRSALGDFPIKLYLTSDAGIASGIELYGYPKYRAEMKFELEENNGSCSIERNGRSDKSPRNISQDHKLLCEFHGRIIPQKIYRQLPF